MSQTIQHDSGSDVPWPTSDARIRVPDTSMLPHSERGGPAGVGLLKHAVQGAHETIDRIAERAAPAVRHLGESVEACEVALHARTNLWRDMRDAWAHGLRTTVRKQPLTSLSAAFALGVLITRIAR